MLFNHIFYNIQFQNASMIGARSQQMGGDNTTTIAIAKSVYYCLVTAFACIPNQTTLETTLFLVFITIVSFLQTLRIAVKKTFFNQRLNYTCLTMKTIKTSLLISLTCTCALNFGKSEFALCVLIVCPFSFGFALYMRARRDWTLY